MNIEYYTDKNRLNQDKHGLSFSEVEAIDWETALTVEDGRFDYGESRYITIGLIKDRLCVVVWTKRTDDIRVISLRKANKREQQRYAKIQQTR